MKHDSEVRVIFPAQHLPKSGSRLAAEFRAPLARATCALSVGEVRGYSALVKAAGEKTGNLSAALPPGSHRHRLTRHDPHLVEAFSDAVRDQVADFRQLFFNMFNRLRAGEAGPEVEGVACECFERWCERSYIVPPGPLHRQVEGALAAEHASAEKVARLLTDDFRFRRGAAAAVSELLYVEWKKKKSTSDKRMELLWPLYEYALWNYATQTAHVYAARLLLYRIGEDQGVFEPRISRQVLESILTPAVDSTSVMPQSESLSLSVIESLRSEMAAFAPSVYESGEFDWWRVVHRDSLTEGELERVQFFEEQLDASSKRLLRLFSAYDLSGIDLDIWRDIYQHYLPAEERQQLGGFYTPQEARRADSRLRELQAPRRKTLRKEPDRSRLGFRRVCGKRSATASRTPQRQGPYVPSSPPRSRSPGLAAGQRDVADHR